MGLIRAAGLDVPLVIVSGTIGEERAVELMRAGATDFVPKGSLARLAPVVQREVRQAAERRGRRVAVERQARDALLLANVRDAVVVTDVGGVVTYWNDGAARLFGWTADETVGRPYADRFPEPARTFIVDEIRRRVAGEEWAGEYEDWRKDGSRVWIDARVTRITDPAGEVVGVLGLSHDITARKRAEDALRASEERYRTLTAATAAIVWGMSAAGEFESEQPGWAAFTGQAFDQYRSSGWLDAIHPDDRAHTTRLWAASLAGRSVYHAEQRVRRADGEYRYMAVRAVPVKDAGGEPREWVGTHTDIHDFRQAQADRDAALARLNVQIERMPLAYLTTDADFRCTCWNPAAERTFGFTAAEVLGRRPFEVLVSAPARPLLANVLDRLRAGDMDTHGTNENVTRDGRVIVCEWHNTPLFARDGSFEGHIALAQDVTDRKAAERAKARLAALVESSDDAIIGTDPDGTITSWNAGAERLYGYAAAEAVGRRYLLLLPPDKEWEADDALRRVGRGDVVPAFSTIRLRKGGGQVDVTVSVSPVRDGSGRVVGASKIARDMTRTKQLEEQFRQAQKMDAVGRLAAGVAHDFNNLLTVINGYGEIVHAALPPGHPSRELVEEITKAGKRAAGLTWQLLAFSRQAVLEPKVLDANALVGDLENMLRRLIGEDTDLATDLAPELGRVKADPGQLEQAVVNLCVNARDAMPAGGKITVETRNVEIDAAFAAAHPDLRAGPYVVLAVSDTGTGMTPDVQARIFEPFFTTKEAGKGTGLGLAMVFGFVKQSGGHVGVKSEVGRGTTFNLYLPRVGDAPLSGKSGVHRTLMPKGTETVLLVEDEDAVRALGRYVLALCGYTVLEAANGPQAVKVADGHAGPLQLLLTDVVMPGGMGGRQVADAVVARHPGAKVLFTSGYTDDAVVRHGVLDEGTHFLQKPFTPAALAQKVRDVLDG